MCDTGFFLGTYTPSHVNDIAIHDGRFAKLSGLLLTARRLVRDDDEREREVCRGS